MSRTIEVLAEVNLCDLDTEDLLDELKARNALPNEDELAVVNKLIKRLRDLGCPQEIINQLEEWEREPIVDLFKLKVWKEACGVS